MLIRHFEREDITTPRLFSVVEVQTGAIGKLFMCIDHYTVCSLVPPEFQENTLIKQIELGTCTLLSFVVRLSEFLT